MQDFLPVHPVLARYDITRESRTNQIAQALAPFLKPGDVLAFWGDLGAGKSAFCRALVRSLCGPETDVPSPTFTLVQIYSARSMEIWHTDLYRLETAEEAFELGLEEAFYEALTLIEWPDRLGPYLPEKRLDLKITVAPENAGRHLVLYGSKDWSHRLGKMPDD